MDDSFEVIDKQGSAGSIRKLYTLPAWCLQRSRINPEVIRYIIAGVSINSIGYVFYLMITIGLGVGHKTAMTGLYAIGTIINFYVNRRWTFRGTASVRDSLVRFLLSITLGYILNFVVLFVFVDLARRPHELVQAGTIVVIAIYFFIINKYYVHAS